MQKIVKTTTKKSGGKKRGKSTKTKVTTLVNKPAPTQRIKRQAKTGSSLSRMANNQI